MTETCHDPLPHLTEHRYLRSRAVQEGANPRAKYAPKSLSWRYNKTATASGSYRDIQEYRRWAWDEARAGRTPKPPLTPHLYRFSVEQERRRRTWYYRCACCELLCGDRGQHDAAVALRWRCREGRAIADSDSPVPGDVMKYAGGIDSDDDGDGGGDDDDNEMARPPGFGFGHIPCRGPVYRLRYRAARQKHPAAEDITKHISDDSDDEEADSGEWDFITGDTDSGSDSEGDDGDVISVWTGMERGLRIDCGSDWFALGSDSDTDGDGA